MRVLVFIIGVILIHPTYAANVGEIFKSDGVTNIGLISITNSIEPGTIVILSEVHNSKEHHDNQSLFLVRLTQSGKSFSVGMEFFDYTKQPLVNEYISGKLAEDEFLQKVEWGGIPFEFYRFQVKLPPYIGGTTVALNAPRLLTKAIAQNGVANLSPDLLKLMPPHFTLGNTFYMERFEAAMGGHISREKLPLYFEAQSTWDETMAWRAVEFMKAHPDQILVIIVGDFHAIYGGGLEDRIRARGHQKVISLSQVAVGHLDEKGIKEAIEPHPRYGKRADYIWLSDK